MLNSHTNPHRRQVPQAALALWQLPQDLGSVEAIADGSLTQEALHQLHLQALHSGRAHHVVQVGDAEGQLWEASRERIVQRTFPAGGELRALLGADGKPLAWWQRHMASPARGKTYQLPYQLPHLSVHAIEGEQRRGRAAQHALQAFFAETFIDDLASVADTDPLEYRLALLKPGSREQRVLKEAALHADWEQAPVDGRGRGLALVATNGALAAVVVEASLDARAQLHVHRITAAIDHGDAQPQPSASLQAEVALLMGLDSALAHPLPAAQRPSIELHFVRSTAPACEQPETASPAVAPALANALYAASGQRTHALPLAHPTVQVNAGRAPAGFLSL